MSHHKAILMIEELISNVDTDTTAKHGILIFSMTEPLSMTDMDITMDISIKWVTF